MAQTQLEKICDSVNNLEGIIKTKQALINSLKQQLEFEEEELLQAKNSCTIIKRSSVWISASPRQRAVVVEGLSSKKIEEEKKNPISSKITPIPVAITHTPKNSKNYQDEVANQDAIKYYFDDQGIDAKQIKLGAHFYSRPNNKKGFIYQGVVSEISATHQDDDGVRKFYYLKVDKTVKSNIGELNPGDKVPEISPGGRGSTKYMRDAAHFSGITPLKKGYFRGIMY